MSRKGIKNRPETYERDGVINFWLAILESAKKGNTSLWVEFTKTKTYQQGLNGKVDVFRIAQGLGNYLRRNDETCND